MSSSSKTVPRLWPGFLLGWIRNQARPADIDARIYVEYIAGVGMIQVNEQRKRLRLPLFEFATILSCIHNSTSDNEPHATLAAATQEMRNRGQHIVVHSRVNTDWSEFIGSEAFEGTVREDSDMLHASYQKPIQARTSLICHDDGSVPVSHTVNNGKAEWYIYNDKEGTVSYLTEGLFFRAGEGDAAHIRFWNPLQGRICRATFLGVERPELRSPEAEPTNLEGAIDSLDINSAQEPGDESINELMAPTEEWVKPKLVLDKHKSKPIQFSTQAGLMRVGWERWAIEEDQNGVFFVLTGYSGNRYKAIDLPGQWVQLFEAGSDDTVQFGGLTGEMIQAKAHKWLASQDTSFYAYIVNGNAYLTRTLPNH